MRNDVLFRELGNFVNVRFEVCLRNKFIQIFRVDTVIRMIKVKLDKIIFFELDLIFGKQYCFLLQFVISLKIYI